VTATIDAPTSQPGSATRPAPGVRVRRLVHRGRPQAPRDFGPTDAKISRLSDLSAGRSHEAYVDVPWDDTGHELHPEDVRLQMPADEPLTQTAWYAGLTETEKARVGAWKLATSLRVGADFENLLQQALLSRALTLPLGAPEFRYLHTEISEESQHSMMFHELAARIGVPAVGMPYLLRRLVALTVPTFARHDPPGFFLTVLAGEDPIDRAQRRWLSAGIAHPTVEKVVRIHVTEESRHVSYARLSIQRDVPLLSPLRRHLLALTTPLVFGYTARVMFVPPPAMAKGLGVDRKILVDAYRTPFGRQFLADSVSKPRKLVADVGLMTPLARVLWRACGIGGPETVKRSRRALRRRAA
jgi:hypothetical protein